jgi:hypothetical protein
MSAVVKTFEVDDRLVRILGRDKTLQLAFTKHALREAKLGNMLPLFSCAISFCSLSDIERDEIADGLLVYRRSDVVRRVEKMLVAYWRGSLIANGWPKEAANAELKQEFGCSRGYVYEAIADNRKRGGMFSL